MTTNLEDVYRLKTKESLDIAHKYHGLLKRKSDKVIVMYSGGMDSISLAWSLLEHTSFDVHIHSIHLDNSEGRIKAEGHAIQQSIAWMQQNQRPFEFSSSFYSYKAKYPGGRDMALALFPSWSGYCNNVWSRSRGIYWRLQHEQRRKVPRRYSIFSALFINKQTKPVWVAPFDYMSKVPLEEVWVFTLLCPKSCAKCIGRVESLKRLLKGF